MGEPVRRGCAGRVDGEPVTPSTARQDMAEPVTSGATPKDADGSAAAEIPTLTWVSQPLRRRPVVGTFVGLGIAMAAVLLGLWTHSLLWGAFSAGALFLSLETFFLPSRYEAGPAELVVQKAFSNARTPWASFRRVYEDRHGLTLSPYRRRAILEAYRAVRLLFDGGDATAIRETVRARCPDAEWLGPGRRSGKESG